MPFNIRDTTQLTSLTSSLEASFVNKLYKSATASDGVIWVRLLCLTAGVACALTTVANAIFRIAEPIFKGLANLFGSPFFKNCSFKKGIYQLFRVLPITTLCLPLSAGYASLTVLAATLLMTSSPKEYMEAQIEFSELLVSFTS